MKTHYFKNWKNTIAFVGQLLMFSSGLFAATPQYVRVSGITNPTEANGIYVKQSGTTGYDPNWEYWKHETATYYIYARRYGGTEYFWNINATKANTDANDNNAIFFSDGAHGVEFLTTFPSPHQVLNWAPLTGAETPEGCIVEEYTGVTSPEISISGNSAAIADNSSSASFSNHTKFGSQNYSSGSVTRTYTISNSGTANLTITNAALSGTNSNQFSITQPLSLTVAAGGSTTFTVTFDPSSSGSKIATVTVNNNDSDEGVYDFAIDGYGYTPGDLVVSGITGTYAAANTGYIHQGVLNGYENWKSANNYYIYNDGSTWNIDNDQNSSIVLFYSANNHTSPSVLNVTGWTAGAGAGTAVVSAAVATADINIKGNSTTIAINVNTPSFADYTKFGSVNISSSSRTRTYTIENTGGASLTSLVVTLGGTDAADFSVTTSPSSSVAAYSSTTFVVTFDPTTVGTKTATVSIASNDPDENPYLFYISGDAFFQNNLVVSGITGTYIAANGTYLYQGILNEFQYWKHSSQNYWVYNSVYSNQHYWYIDTDQSSTSLLDFLFAKISEDVAPVGLTGWTIGTGATGSPAIVYASPEMDVKGNSTTIVDNDVSPSTADYTDFGSVNVSSGTVSRTFSIYNTGYGALNLSGTPKVVVSGTNAADFTVSTQPTSPVAATTGTTTFTVQFDPTASGTRSGTISIANNDSDENPYNFSIQGTGYTTPTVTNTTASSIATTSATLGGNVTADGSATVDARGIIYSTTDATPTIAEGATSVAIGSGTGSFSQSVSSLSQGTTYYYNAYGHNSAGYGYGTASSFTTQNTVSSIVRVGSTPTKSTSVQWTVTFAVSLTGLSSTNFSLANIGLTTPSISSVTGSGTTWTVTANTGSGSGTLGLNMANSAGLSTVLSNPTYAGEVYTIDKTAPTVSITSTASSTTNTSPIPVTITFSESVTGFDAGDITVGNGTKGALSGSGASYSISITPSGQGAVTVDVAAGVATDAAGNGNTVATQLSRTYDTVAPTASITSTASNPTNTSPITVTITFSESVTGFAVGDITVGNGTNGALSGSGASYSINITPLGQGAVTVDVAAGVATDAAGNGNTVAIQLSRTYDNVAPTTSITSTASNPTNTSPIPVTITFSESVTGFAVGDITVGNGTNGALSGSGASYSINITPSGQGAVTVDVAAGVASDAAGNGNTIATQLSRTYDSVSPTVTIASTASNPTSTSPIPVTFTFSESVTGFVVGDITVGNGTKGALSGSGASYSINITPSGQGAVTVDVAAGVASDVAGNGNTIATQLSRTYDSVSPTVTIASTASNPTSTSPIPVTFTFSESVTGFAVGDITVGNGTKGTLSGSGASYSINITPSGQGAVTVDVAAGVASDAASNGNTVATQLSRTYDSVAPTVSSINRQTPSEESTLETSVLFRVTFSEPVNNVDINDFSLTITGASSTISSVSSSTGTTIDVLVSNISGYSTIRLDLKSSGTEITDVASNAISGGFTTGQTYITLTAGTWTGTTNTDWATATNWAGGSVPISTSDVIIPDVTNDPIISASTSADCNNLTVNSGASLTIESSGSGTGSLIVTGTPTGNVACQSYMTADVWHMVSSPVSGQTIASFLAANSLIAVKSGTDTRAMKNYLETTDAWSDYFTNSTSGSLGDGKGFSVIVWATTGGTVNYAGTLQTGNVNIAITRTPSTGFGWNLVGNPYSSAIAINTAAGTDNFINNNSSDLNQNYCGIYYWNGSAYVPVNLSDGAFYAQVGQGFFVKSKTGGGTISFIPSLQTHRPTTEFKNAVIPWPEIKLVATLGDISNNTVIRFNEAMNQGLDVGYDAGSMKSGFDIYTKLVDDNGVDFGIQCLPLTANKDMVIPIGLESNNKGTVALSVDINNLSSDCQVTFEDRETGMVTPVSKSGQLVSIQVDVKSKVVGRFFLHISYLKNTTGVTSLPEDWRIYVTHGQICISGSVTDNATAAIYDLLGRKVRTYQLQNGSLNHIPCSDFRNGVYLISIRQKRGTFTKKITVIN